MVSHFTEGEKGLALKEESNYFEGEIITPIVAVSAKIVANHRNLSWFILHPKEVGTSNLPCLLYCFKLSHFVSDINFDVISSNLMRSCSELI